MVSDCLAHYGVLGMKWGVRRYQNKDGTLTAQGRKRAKREYRADNKEAYKKGRNATIADIAKRYAYNNYVRATTKWEKDIHNEKAISRLKQAGNVYKNLSEASEKAFAEMTKHRDSLVKKYGKEAVSNIRYDKKGRLNEKTTRGSEWVAAFALSGAMSAGLIAGGIPAVVVFGPSTGHEQGRSVYERAVVAENKASKKKE